VFESVAKEMKFLVMVPGSLLAMLEMLMETFC
jgi:hypothetical protein